MGRLKRQTPKSPFQSPRAKTEATRLKQAPLENEVQRVSTCNTSGDKPRNWKRRAVFILIIVIAGCLNSYNGYTLFENDSFFSHLSNLEREMTFRTEMGLYYSYFKIFVNAPTVFEGLSLLVANNRTEHPATINVLQRFNLYPELVIGVAYRVFNQVTTALAVEAQDCWTVTRGNDRNAIQSCSGLGDPATFYVTSVYLWNFISGASIAAIAGLLSDSVLATILACACYFFNFDESTRIQWSPALRESFAYPLLIFQMFLTSVLIRSKINVGSCLAYTTVTTCCLLCWQFSQFVLATEVSCLFLIFSLHAAIHHRQLQYIANMHLCSMLIAYIFLFFNDMLFSSLYTIVVMACIISCRTRAINKDNWSVLKVVKQWAFFGANVIVIKIICWFVHRVEDNSHVWNLLRSKISSYEDFDTMLYTCAPEFDFLTLDYAKALCRTLIYPLLLFLVVAVRALVHRQKFAPELLYNFYQCLVFGVLAFFIMRLKMLFTPHLCIIVSLALCPRYYHMNKVRIAVAIGILAIIALPGWNLVSSQHSHKREFSNPDLEELILFINDFAGPDDSFTGPMPLMANILLSTGRSIVNHPHYENLAIRQKTKLIYTLLSRKPLKEVHKNLQSVLADYVVIPRTWCFGRLRSGCSLAEIWDKLDPGNRGNPLVCERLINEDTEDLFEVLFQNNDLTLLAIL